MDGADGTPSVPAAVSGTPVAARTSTAAEAPDAARPAANAGAPPAAPRPGAAKERPGAEDVEPAAVGEPFAELTPSVPAVTDFAEAPVLLKTLGWPELWCCFGRRLQCARWAPVACVEWSRLLLIR